MHGKLTLAIVIAALSLQSVFAEEFPAGKIVDKVVCSDDRDFSYVLYLPTSYQPARKEKYPVLFVMGPGGGNANELRRYIRGAEKNNWILAMSIESRNRYNLSDRALDAMVEDVFDRFPVNTRRCYSSGMSGGGREAFSLALRMKGRIIGIIPCGAGDSSSPYSGSALAYGLCGGRCFNRWDMAITFNNRFRSHKGHLRFFHGGHDWAGDSLLCDAISWMNGQYLKKKGSREELAEFSTMLLGEIEQKMDSDPYSAYENACVLADIQKAPDCAKAKKIVAKLKADPKVKAYVQALKDLDDFVDQHFNTNVMDYRNNPVNSRQESDAQRLQEKYKETPLASVFEDFGKACVSP